MPIPIIDLFAGPGGLGEGFSKLHKDQKPVFKIELSIEKDEHAHQTLELRAFFRQFPHGVTPKAYYDYLAGTITRSELFEKFPSQAERAKNEAWHAELGGSKFPNKIIDERINTALKGKKTWVLIGGPPCQAYSLVGRSRIIGGESLEHYENDERHHLYRRYLRILAVYKPPVFVMENVKGLLSARRKKRSVFDRILLDLENPAKFFPGICNDPPLESVGYKLFTVVTNKRDAEGKLNPKDFVVRAEDYGVPQARHRIIIVGVRSDLQKIPKLLKTKTKVTVYKAIHDLPVIRSGLTKMGKDKTEWHDVIKAAEKTEWFEELSPQIKQAAQKALSNIKDNLTRGGMYVTGNSVPGFAVQWFRDTAIGGFCNHETRGHIIQDLHRYFFAAVFAKIHGRSPLLEDLPKALLPKHKNVAAALKETKFNDRFRVQISGRPSTTVVSHIAKDGHYYIHYDPTQCRSLTVREAARLQTFPDNYFFEGPRTQQYHQVGNAVPPLLANQIAKIVAEIFSD